jgi:single-stranded-DNA-specific exonuclease
MKTKDISRFQKWEIVGKIRKQNKPDEKSITEILFANRGIKTKEEKKEFLSPTHPNGTPSKEIGIKTSSINKAIKRLISALREKEDVVIYGDYDADGVCATAILWETLYSLGFNVMPFLPGRFTDGYGLNSESIKNLKSKNKNLKLIVTVDNGIVANEAVETAASMGIDVIITDHHTAGKKLPGAHSIVHTTKTSGSGISWFLSKELLKALPVKRRPPPAGLELAAIGTIADQIPLLGINRNIAKHGLSELNKTKREGLNHMFKESAIEKGNISTYEVGFLIAPRINAMGRLEHSVDSLRLLCTRDKKRANELSFLLAKINKDRQRIVEEVIAHAQSSVTREKLTGVILLAHESYHEGVIGLAASKLVEKYYRPAIVVSKGELVSKASARSISGFNIIEVIRQMDDIILTGGGHPMAAGFSIETEKIEMFNQRMQEISGPILTDEVLQKKLKIDMEIMFDSLKSGLFDKISKFEPFGIGNPAPTFITQKVKIITAKTVGKDQKHLKMKVENNGRIFDCIAFGFGEAHTKLMAGTVVDMAYTLEENHWNESTSLQLKLKDIRLNR